MTGDSFRLALKKTIEDHDRYGDIDSGDWEENGAMRAVGIARSDSLRFATMMMDEYGEDLQTGNTCAECGRALVEDGECPEGHEVVGNPDSRRMETLLAIVELALATGVHLERQRWEGATPT